MLGLLAKANGLASETAVFELLLFAFGALLTVGVAIVLFYVFSHDTRQEADDPPSRDEAASRDDDPQA